MSLMVLLADCLFVVDRRDEISTLFHSSIAVCGKFRRPRVVLAVSLILPFDLDLEGFVGCPHWLLKATFNWDSVSLMFFHAIIRPSWAHNRFSDLIPVSSLRVFTGTLSASVFPAIRRIVAFNATCIA